MAWLVWLDRWDTATGEQVFEAELVCDTLEDALACARESLDGCRRGQRTRAEVVEMFHEENVLLSETVEA